MVVPQRAVDEEQVDGFRVDDQQVIERDGGLVGAGETEGDPCRLTGDERSGNARRQVQGRLARRGVDEAVRDAPGQEGHPALWAPGRRVGGEAVRVHRTGEHVGGNHRRRKGGSQGAQVGAQGFERFRGEGVVARQRPLGERTAPAATVFSWAGSAANGGNARSAGLHRESWSGISASRASRSRRSVLTVARRRTFQASAAFAGCRTLSGTGTCARVEAGSQTRNHQKNNRPPRRGGAEVEQRGTRAL